jgi:hypothetical protein
MSAETDAFLIYGTREVEPQPIRLMAGKLTADLSGGNLRTITYDGVEVLRAVSYLVRDRDWGTYAPQIADMTIDQTDNAFAVSYVAHCEGPDGTDLTIRVRISPRPTRR